MYILWLYNISRYKLRNFLSKLAYQNLSWAELFVRDVADTRRTFRTHNKTELSTLPSTNMETKNINNNKYYERIIKLLM